MFYVNRRLWKQLFNDFMLVNYDRKLGRRCTQRPSPPALLTRETGLAVDKRKTHLVLGVGTLGLACLGVRQPLRAGAQAGHRNVTIRDTNGCDFCRQRPCLGVFSLQAFSSWEVHPIILQEPSPGRRLWASVPSGYFLSGKVPYICKRDS